MARRCKESDRAAAMSERSMAVVTTALVVGDTLAVVAAYEIATAFVYRAGGAASSVLPLYLTQAFWAVAIWPLVFWAIGLYDRKIDLSVIDQWPKLAAGVSVATMLRLTVVILASGLLGQDNLLGYQVAVLAWAMALVLLPVERMIVRYLQSRARLRGATEKRTLIIGAGHVAVLMADKMIRNPRLGLTPVGFLDPDPMTLPERDKLGLPMYTDVRDLERILRNEQVNHALVAFSSDGFCKIFEIIERCCDCGVDVSVVPRFFEISAADPKTDEIEGVPVMTLQRTTLTPGLAFAKRAMDLVLGTLILIVSLPVQAVVAVSIVLDTPGPILHGQERIGKDGRPFTMYKFRSMVNGAGRKKDELLKLNEATGPIFKMQSDPRVTRVGRFIRRFSLDELPQIYNVLKGDMSLVGPRPPLPREVAEYTDWDTKRLRVTPGITGLWQVLGRSELTFDEMVSLDLNYIWNWSPWLDFSIMARTVGAVVHGRGAY